jgi:hypothetical protein
MTIISEEFRATPLNTESLSVVASPTQSGTDRPDFFTDADDWIQSYVQAAMITKSYSNQWFG